MEAYKNYKREDEKLQGMSKRARTAELVMGLLVVIILNCACIAYCKMYNKKKTTDRMQLEVNESVSQYFALAHNDNDIDSQAQISSSRLEVKNLVPANQPRSGDKNLSSESQN